MTVGIVGGGPAGLLAAVLLTETGHNVTLFDEQATVGGHLTWDEYPVAGTRATSTWLSAVEATLAGGTIDVRSSTVVWAAYRRGETFELALNRHGTHDSFVCDHLIVATGTTDRPLIVPGSTLPGVLTARALRILTRRHGITPGQRMAIAGNGTEVKRLANDLTALGLDVVITVAAPDVVSIDGIERVQSIAINTGENLEVDTVVVAVGEAADFQLARMLGAGSSYVPATRSWVCNDQPDGSHLHLVGGALSGAAVFADVVASAVKCVSSMTGTTFESGTSSPTEPSQQILEMIRS